MPNTIKHHIEVGQVFGLGQVIELVTLDLTPAMIRAGRKTGNRGCVLRCKCGTIYRKIYSDLVSGLNRSCGCWRANQSSVRFQEMAERGDKVIHGLSQHYLYGTWQQMMARCYHAHRPNYPLYGGRAISVADEWHDVANFITYLETVLGPRPDGFTLDRIDNDGDYEPGNVRWADRSTQNRNKNRVSA